MIRVEGLFEECGGDLVQLFAEDAYYTLNKITGVWIKIPVGVEMPQGTLITREMYEKIKKGTPGHLDLDPAKETK